MGTICGFGLGREGRKSEKMIGRIIARASRVRIIRKRRLFFLALTICIEWAFGYVGRSWKWGLPF